MKADAQEASPAPAPEPTGVARHLYTAAPATEGRGGGFASVAWSAALESRLEAVEKLVDGYRPGDLGDPGCRQLVRVAGSTYALTTFTPLGAMPDGRPGNYWAETVLVPASWLEHAGWDAAAAFAALDWRGPQDLEALDRDLPPETAPVVTPQPLARLRALVEIVPPRQLRPLVQLVAQQPALGLSPFRILEAADADPADLGTVVTLAPLLLPPALRVLRDGDSRRCLTLRTRSPRGGMSPRTDLTGLPAASHDGVEETVPVVDLGDRAVPGRVDRAGAAYAAWLAERLEAGRWDELEALYREPIDGPAKGWLAGFERRGGRAPAVAARQTPAAADPPAARAASPAPPASRPAGPSTYEKQRGAWEVRDEVEAEIWSGLERYRQTLEAEVGRLRQEMDEAVAAARSDLEKTAKAQRRHLDEQRRKAIEALENAAGEGLRELDDRGKAAKRKAGEAAGGDALLRRVEDLERDFSSLRTRIRAASGGASLRDAADAEREPDVPAASRTKRSPSPASLPHSISQYQTARSRSEDLRAFVRGPVGRGAAVVAVLAVAALVTWWYLGRDAPSAVTTSPRPAAGTPAAERLDELETRLRDGDLAAALLRRASDDPRLAARSRDVGLALALGRTVTPDEAARCVLLQTALAAEAADGAPPAVTVDGDCGPGTRAALAAATAEGCCAELADAAPDAFPARRDCAIAQHLELGDPASCDDLDPWREERDWALAEAVRARELFATAATALRGSGAEAERQALVALAPESVAPLLDDLAAMELSASDAALLLDLAWAVAADDPATAVSARPSGPELDRLEALIDELADDAASPSTEAAPASAGRDPAGA